MTPEATCVCGETGRWDLVIMEQEGGSTGSVCLYVYVKKNRVQSSGLVDYTYRTPPTRLHTIPAAACWSPHSARPKVPRRPSVALTILRPWPMHVRGPSSWKAPSVFPQSNRSVCVRACVRMRGDARACPCLHTPSSTHIYRQSTATHPSASARGCRGGRSPTRAHRTQCPLSLACPAPRPRPPGRAASARASRR